jgi:hypothetical protein
MTKKLFKSIVIDASVACSCGEQGLHIHEIRGKAIRDFLNAMLLETEHHAVMTKEIGDEWNNHSHSFARKWRRYMDGKRRIDHLNISPNSTLKRKIETLDCSDKDLQLMLKDQRLIDAAIGADNTVASLDETVRKLFAKGSIQIEELRDIVWVNPTNDDEEPVLWLKNGAEPEEGRMLSRIPHSG